MSAFPEPLPSPSQESETGPQEMLFQDQPVFFPVGLWKLGLMSVCTLGIYPVYWSFRNWKLLRDHDGMEISPFWRSAFYPLWSFSLFRIIRGKARDSGIPVSFSPNGMGLAVVFFNAIVRLPDPFWLLSLLSFVPLVMVQSTVTEINRLHAPLADANEELSGKNLLALILGGSMIVLALIASFLPGE